jgi:hypothetical protein
MIFLNFTVTWSSELSYTYSRSSQNGTVKAEAHESSHVEKGLLLRLETTASLSYLLSLWQRLASDLMTIVAQSQRLSLMSRIVQRGCRCADD